MDVSPMVVENQYKLSQRQFRVSLKLVQSQTRVRRMDVSPIIVESQSKVSPDLVRYQSRVSPELVRSQSRVSPMDVVSPMLVKVSPSLVELVQNQSKLSRSQSKVSLSYRFARGMAVQFDMPDLLSGGNSWLESSSHTGQRYSAYIRGRLYSSIIVLRHHSWWSGPVQSQSKASPELVQSQTDGCQSNGTRKQSKLSQGGQSRVSPKLVQSQSNVSRKLV